MAQLSSQGMQANQQITFLSDGADNLRDLQFNLYPESQHVPIVTPDRFKRA
ncbi:hypothetical protein [Photorhabdus antumapuensis]|uniref:hypothetical protein n=1 Tax=Photorhabdus antumapuensis TaxID=2862867 RepID=UPI003BB7E832